MSRKQKQHYIVEHLWRALRSGCILLGMAIWLYVPDMEWLVFTFGILAAVVDQLHGLICKYIQKSLGWAVDFSEYE